MRSILLASIFVAVVPFVASAFAGTAITREMANGYFKNCMAQSDPRITPESQEDLCACTALKMQENFSVEEMKALGGNDSKAREAINKMMTGVYGPCMEFPVRDMVMGECLKNKELEAATKNYKAMCGCVADETGQFLAAEAPRILTEAFALNPNSVDPNEVVMSNAEVQNKIRQKTLSCIEKFR